MKNEISAIKVGDLVYTLEYHISIPGGMWKWDSIVTTVDTSYIETEYTRDWKLEWLTDLCKRLAPNHRTFSKQTVKNYFSPTGKINIEIK